MTTKKRKTQQKQSNKQEVRVIDKPKNSKNRKFKPRNKKHKNILNSSESLQQAKIFLSDTLKGFGTLISVSCKECLSCIEKLKKK